MNYLSLIFLILSTKAYTATLNSAVSLAANGYSVSSGGASLTGVGMVSGTLKKPLTENHYYEIGGDAILASESSTSLLYGLNLGYTYCLTLCSDKSFQILNDKIESSPKRYQSISFLYVTRKVLINESDASYTGPGLRLRHMELFMSDYKLIFIYGVDFIGSLNRDIIFHQLGLGMEFRI